MSLIFVVFFVGSVCEFFVSVLNVLTSSFTARFMSSRAFFVELCRMMVVM